MDISIESIKKEFDKAGYICDNEVIVTIYLALKMEKPILIEGEPGVGKTELGKVLSRVFETELWVMLKKLPAAKFFSNLVFQSPGAPVFQLKPFWAFHFPL